MNVIIKIGMWSIIMLVVSLMSTFECQATAPDSLVYTLRFRQGDDLLVKHYGGNEHSLAAMAQLMSVENISRISKIEIIGSTSPEGTIERNKRLTEQRANAIRNYFLWRYKNLPRESIHISEQEESNAWLLAVEADAQIPNRDKIVKIIKRKSSIPTKWANIQLQSKESAEYMEQQIFPLLRNAVACVISFDHTKTKSPIPSHFITQDNTPSGALIVADTRLEVTNRIATKNTTVIASDAIANTKVEAMSEKTMQNPVPAVIGNKEQQEWVEKPNKPLFALKTNLLFDVATILNLEFEVPVGKYFSVAVEGMFPWWLWEDKQNCIQVMSGNVEGRFWFGDRSKRPVMTGWHAGIYAGGGYYDLEMNRKGYQGEFFIAAGLSGGFAHTINKRGTLRMEYGIGVGYMSTNYRRYEARFSDMDNSWHLYSKESGRFSWFGPTRAKVSLVWVLDTGIFQKKGVRK